MYVESKFIQWCKKEVSELQHFCKHQRRNWTANADEVNEGGVVVSGGFLVSPYPPHVFAKNRNMFTAITADEEGVIKTILEEELKGESC